MIKAGFIGTGKMGTLLLERIHSDAAHSVNLKIYNRTREKAEPFIKYAQVMDNWQSVVDECEVLFLCVPFRVLPEIFEYIKKNNYVSKHLVIIAMGIQCSVIEEYISLPVTRLLPSVLLELERLEMFYSHNDRVESSHLEVLQQLLGKNITLTGVPEVDLENFSKLVSCGPALISEFIMSFRSSISFTGEYDFLDKVFNNTVADTIALSESRNITLKEVQNKVCTPGGASERGVKILSSQLPEILKNAFSDMQQANENRKTEFKEMIKNKIKE